jgi:preprotein translocase subunit SecG
MLCFLLIVVVLLQESKTQGLGASFGGDAGTSLFGTSTADVMKKITVWMIALFMSISFLLSVVSSVKPIPAKVEMTQEVSTP